MAIEVFNRCEYKYIINNATYLEMTKCMNEHMIHDAYNRDGRAYTISNIYYDTKNYDFIKNSIQKPAYKEKLRLRAYGVPSIDDNVFLEIKKKYKGVVNKRRTTIKLKTAYDFVKNKTLEIEEPNMNLQVVNEIKHMLNNNDLVPKVYIAYDRMAYFDKNDSNFRVSFDTNIRTRHDDLGLEYGDSGKLLLENGIWIMEIKALGAMPMWIAKKLSQKNIVRTGFSKYGTYYKQIFKDSICC